MVDDLMPMILCDVLQVALILLLGIVVLHG